MSTIPKVTHPLTCEQRRRLARAYAILIKIGRNFDIERIAVVVHRRAQKEEIK